jgi:carbonic anhydrase
MRPDSGDKAGEIKSWTSRRQFLKALAAGGAGAVLGLSFCPERALAKGHADALLLSCMDYRLMNKTAHYMKKRGLKNKYDHVVLAGAALGAITEKYPDWNKTFWEELELSIELHHIERVILLDHRDCGAYSQLMNEDFAQKPVEETKIHAAQSNKLREMIKEKYSKLEVEMLLMSLDGKVENI